MIETRCELKVRTVVTMKTSLFSIRAEIYLRFRGNNVGCTLFRYVGEFLPDYTVSHPRTEYSLRRIVFGDVRIGFLTIVEMNLVRRPALVALTDAWRNVYNFNLATESFRSRIIFAEPLIKLLLMKLKTYNANEQG